MNETGTQQRIMGSKMLRERFQTGMVNTIKCHRKARLELHNVSRIRHLGASSGLTTTLPVLMSRDERLSCGNTESAGYS